MRTGNRLFLILYAMSCLLSGTHSAGRPINEQAIVSMLDLFSLFQTDAEEEHTGDACLFVAYALNGGTNHEDNKSIIYESDFPFTLEVPTREGYNFAGWYTDSNFKNKISELNPSMVSELVLFAKWTKQIDNYHNVEAYSYKTRYSQAEDNQKLLTDCDYSFWEEMNIPGMPKTRERDYLNRYITQAAQCMQGLCTTPDYILMTSYAESDTIPGTLMIFDRETGAYLVSITMKVNSHLGGVTYDGENIWICHSESKTLERIDYRFVQRIAESGARYCVDVSGISTEYQIKDSPSCIASYGGRIWVATHTTVFDGEMVSYLYNPETDQLTAMSEYKVPKKVQGVAFDETGAIYFSTSYGRKNSSYLKAYTSLIELNQNPENPTVEVEMPPCSEGVAFENGSLLVLFESASEKYFEGTDGKGKSTAPLDTLLEIEIASLW